MYQLRSLRRSDTSVRRTDAVFRVESRKGRSTTFWEIGMNDQEFQQRPTVDRLRSVIQSLQSRLSELEHQNQQLRQS